MHRRTVTHRHTDTQTHTQNFFFIYIDISLKMQITFSLSQAFHGEDGFFPLMNYIGCVFLRSSSIGALQIPLKTSSKCKKRLAPKSREIEGNRLLKLTEIRIADDFSFMREGHIGSVPVEHYFFVLHKSWSALRERSKSC